MSKELRVIMKKVNKGPDIKFIPDSLMAMKGIVDGYIEMVPFTKNVVIICDEEGVLKGKQFNFGLCGIELSTSYITKIEIYGDCFFVRKEGDNLVSLTNEDLNFLDNIFRKAKILDDILKGGMPMDK